MVSFLRHARHAISLAFSEYDYERGFSKVNFNVIALSMGPLVVVQKYTVLNLSDENRKEHLWMQLPA